MKQAFSQWMQPLPLVAILRGIKANEVEAHAEVLVEVGFRLIEVPLNSPDPFTSIARLQQRFGQQVLIGAGTVLQHDQLQQLVQTGAGLMVCPHTDITLIRAAKEAGLFALPGFFTPSEAFAALAAGADGLKLFPAEALPSPQALAALKAVLPPETWVLPVGGVNPKGMQEYVNAGARGFGLGSALYKAGQSLEDTRQKAQAFVQGWQHVESAR